MNMQGTDLASNLVLCAGIVAAYAKHPNTLNAK